MTGFGYDIAHESKDAINFWGKLKELGNIDFIIAHRKYALAMLARSKSYEIVPGYTVNVVVPEDIIGLKLQAMANDPSRVPQDRVDVQWLIKNHHQNLDYALLKEYFSLFGQEAVLANMYKEINYAK